MDFVKALILYTGTGKKSGKHYGAGFSRVIRPCEPFYFGGRKC